MIEIGNVIVRVGEIGVCVFSLKGIEYMVVVDDN